MARYAIIENGIVANIAIGEGFSPPDDSWHLIPDTSTVAIGDSFDGGAFSKPAIPIEQAKADAWAQVKARREALTDSPGATVATPVGVVQSDAKSQQNILGLVQMAVLAQMTQKPFSADFTLADNSVVTINAQKMIGLGVAVGQHVQATYARSRVLRAAIDAAEDDKALSAIDLEAGWP
jgi:hypothetical protein